MDKPTVHFFIMDFILLIACISFILAIFNLTGGLFLLEFRLLVVFLVLLTAGMSNAFYNNKKGWISIASILALMIIDIFFMFIFSGLFRTSNLVTILSSLVGILIALLGAIQSSHEQQGKGSGPYYPADDGKKIEAKEEISKEEMKQEIKEEIKDELKEVSMKKSFFPGKYVASRKANKYHTPKCDWANRIKKGNEVWFQSKEEAEKNGFEADECVN